MLANLRNLAIAEARAATDALTGLPNKRAVRDTLKRMVAQALAHGHPAGGAADRPRPLQADQRRLRPRAPATRCSPRSARRSARAARRATSSAATAARSSWCCCPTPTAQGRCGGRRGAARELERLERRRASTATVTGSVGVAVLPEDAADGDRARAPRRPRALRGEGRRAQPRARRGAVRGEHADELSRRPARRTPSWADLHHVDHPVRVRGEVVPQRLRVVQGARPLPGPARRRGARGDVLPGASSSRRSSGFIAR